MNRVMLDLETMGTSSNAAIIAIGAVKFDKEVTDKFHVIIDLQSSMDAGLEIDGNTVLWWMQQSDDARAHFKKEGVSLTDALMMFYEWFEYGDEVWGNGAAFDNVILLNAYKAVGLQPPWKFWKDRCYRTLKSLYPEITKNRVGTLHCAVDDAESQARHLIKILAAVAKKD